MDLDRLRDRAELLALEHLVVMLMRATLDASPSAARDFPRLAQTEAEKLGHQHPKGASAEEGDLMAAELQNAWEALVRRIVPPTA